MADEIQDLLSQTIAIIDTPNQTINVVDMEKIHTTAPQEILCPRCGSNQVQMYIYNKCYRRFNNKGAPIGMQTPADQMGAALRMYYSGMSLSGIARQLDESFGTKVDPATV